MWPYIVKDNYLSSDKFNSLLDEVKDIKVKDGEVYRKFFSYDPTPEIGEEIKQFTKKRSEGPYQKLIHFAVTPANFFHKEHYEAPFKIMSAIVYLSPEKNLGTTLVDYRTPGPNEGDLYEKITLDWKPNRMMTFCGETDVTWHYYESTDVRYTYNYFLVDASLITNEEFARNVIY